jgi:hypothetical protein
MVCINLWIYITYLKISRVKEAPSSWYNSHQVQNSITLCHVLLLLNYCTPWQKYHRTLHEHKLNYIGPHEWRCGLRHCDTVTRSWGTSSCPWSPISQGSVQKFLEAENVLALLWPSYSDRSPIEHVWNALDEQVRVFQFLPISSNFMQPLKSGTTFHRTQSTAWSTLYEDVTQHEANGGHTRYWLVFWSTPFVEGTVSVMNRCISIFPVVLNP